MNEESLSIMMGAHYMCILHICQYNNVYILVGKYMGKETLGERVKKTRLAMGYKSQTEFANLVGIPQPTLCRIEANKVKTTQKLLDLANALNVDPTWLLNGDTDEPVKENLSENSIDLHETIKILQKNVEYLELRCARLERLNNIIK